MSDSYSVTVDLDVCTGHGRCVELLPAVFEFNADGFSHVRDDAVYPEIAAAERVAALCPELAITVERRP